VFLQANQPAVTTTRLANASCQHNVKSNIYSPVSSDASVTRPSPLPCQHHDADGAGSGRQLYLSDSDRSDFSDLKDRHRLTVSRVLIVARMRRVVRLESVAMARLCSLACRTVMS
jgi:hypothetical protein